MKCMYFLKYLCVRDMNRAQCRVTGCVICCPTPPRRDRDAARRRRPLAACGGAKFVLAPIVKIKVSLETSSSRLPLTRELSAQPTAGEKSLKTTAIV